ncbi:MAG: site-specific DNA-methyltransferase [Calditrichota bacterium]
MSSSPPKPRAPRNKTLRLTDQDRERLTGRLLRLEQPAACEAILNRTIHQDLYEVLPLLPPTWVDLLFIDPPYNLTKSFNGSVFRRTTEAGYETWLRSWFPQILRLLKPRASVYICGDWRSSGALQKVVSEFLQIRNRITWEREKGRGAGRNWKNASEDIWFATVSDDYVFNLEAVKLRRRVIAPYTDAEGKPKDWLRTKTGGLRLTHPSNLWTDLTVPFWSMPENTDHPTQKPEKLLAKIILASSHPGDVVFDPFLGSGTTSVVAKKLGRQYVGVEIDEEYCLLAEKRLELAEEDSRIQGFENGEFLERNARLGSR